MPDEDFPTEVGCVGTLTHRIPGGEQPGEVRVHYRGSVEHYLAYASEPIPDGSSVLVVGRHGPRALDVIEWTEPVGINRSM